MTQYDALGSALVSEISFHIKNVKIQPGVYAGFDPAELKDKSGFIILSKDFPTVEDPEPFIHVKMIKDLTIGIDGLKNQNYLQQVKKVLEYDQKYKFTKLCIDVTKDKFMLEYLQTHLGYRVEGVVFSQPIKQELIAATRIVFQEKMIQLNPKQSNFKTLRKELYELNPKTLKHPEGGHDDFVWALSLAVKAMNCIDFRRKIIKGYTNDEYLFF